MTKNELIVEHQTVCTMLEGLEQTGLGRFERTYQSLYHHVHGAYTADKEHSDFYHIREFLKLVDRFPAVAKKNQASEFSEIRSQAHVTLKDLRRVIEKTK